MLLGSVIPVQGADLASVITALEARRDKIDSGHTRTLEERLTNYKVWAAETSGLLRHSFELEQVEALVNSRRHDFLSIAQVLPGDHLSINTMIDAERDDRRRVFTNVIEDLKAINTRVKSLPTHGVLIVPDTNFFLHHECYFDKVDWFSLTTERQFRVMIPMAVVRELDKAKRAQPGKKVSDSNDESVRTRARVTSRRIREMFEYVEDTHVLGSDRGIEMLLDPIGHQHLVDADTEIIERALALKALTGKKVFIATGDGTMQFMVGVARLEVIALPD